MKSWLYPGAKVVCVDCADNGLPDGDGFDEGEVCTVREVMVVWDQVGVRIVGRKGPTHPLFGPDCPYDANCFRPLYDTSKQIEALRKLVEPSNLPAKVDA
jgi:hypothetical protein